mgnify:CR=1 FL=1
MIHDRPEPGGDQRGKEHPGIARRKRRQILEVPQGLIGPRRVRVVVRVPLQVEQELEFTKLLQIWAY